MTRAEMSAALFDCLGAIAVLERKVRNVAIELHGEAKGEKAVDDLIERSAQDVRKRQRRNRKKGGKK